ncbi:hypothetical protein TcWFU_010395 [Taenia crassiceps]|uniref:Uncharacterized protein n=1 Tax=Taenia crassiceps TaxID=6207 RepID=A0ABR4QTR2_9CEST
MPPPTIKCVLVGDGAVGKTCLLIKKKTGNFPQSYIPTTTYQLTLLDTAGQEDYVVLRRKIYPDTSVFMLCFSVGLRSSFQNVVDKWAKDIEYVCPKTPILLVGCKVDVRSTAGVNAIQYFEGKKLAKEIGAVQYMECSALTYDGVDDVFNEAVLIGAGLERALGGVRAPIALMAGVPEVQGGVKRATMGLLDGWYICALSYDVV